MADFFNEFWHWYVAVITVLSILGCGILLWSQSTYKVKLRADGKPELTTGHVWDEDLTELNTPMPRWWIVLFWLTIVFGFGYLALYPGLGSYAGKLGWNSSGEYKAELKQAKAEYGPLFAQYAQQDLKAVAADPHAQAIGERLFLTYCAQCHGSDARGSKGFPNLADGDWLHGGEPSTIKQTIMQGRVGMMPPMGAALGSDKDIESVASYVRSLSGLSADPIKVSFGKPKFAACVACHGAKGEGNPALGAPNLADKVWLYGGSQETVMETIRKGRTNTMPAFGEFLGEEKVHVLAAYVWSLSHPQQPKTLAPAQPIVTAAAK
ncbi:cytochrome-c oxidase, cbb3-type subunit III [Massilia oculi]|uniref:Cbb3-type cytochrome c oxidase subunit n=1 Tax=Massilia hydrophila TaxID=3044279 RepID=A0ABS7Y6G7_9BURK|nr:cytochrome-c oxidase, cbb3-type subunit III [Massilia oculi]